MPVNYYGFSPEKKDYSYIGTAGQHIAQGVEDVSQALDRRTLAKAKKIDENTFDTQIYPAQIEEAVRLATDAGLDDTQAHIMAVRYFQGRGSIETPQQAIERLNANDVKFRAAINTEREKLFQKKSQEPVETASAQPGALEEPQASANLAARLQEEQKTGIYPGPIGTPGQAPIVGTPQPARPAVPAQTRPQNSQELQRTAIGMGMGGSPVAKTMIDQSAEAENRELQMKKLDQSIGYQNASLQQRNAGLGLQERGVQAQEAGTLISAQNSAEAARKNAQQEAMTREKTLRDDITKYSEVIRKGMSDSAAASEIGDDQAKKEAESAISSARSAQARAKKELTTHLSEQQGITYAPEAVDMAVKLQDAAEDSSPEATPIALHKYISEVMQSEDYKPSLNTPDKEGNPSSVAQQVSDLAKEIHIFAWSKGMKTPGTLKFIQDQIDKGAPVEMIIQGIINLTDKKSTGR